MHYITLYCDVIELNLSVKIQHCHNNTCCSSRWHLSGILKSHSYQQQNLLTYWLFQVCLSMLVRITRCWITRIFPLSTKIFSLLVQTQTENLWVRTHLFYFVFLRSFISFILTSLMPCSDVLCIICSPVKVQASCLRLLVIGWNFNLWLSGLT